MKVFEYDASDIRIIKLDCEEFFKLKSESETLRKIVDVIEKRYNYLIQSILNGDDIKITNRHFSILEVKNEKTN